LNANRRAVTTFLCIDLALAYQQIEAYVKSFWSFLRFRISFHPRARCFCASRRGGQVGRQYIAAFWRKPVGLFGYMCMKETICVVHFTAAFGPPFEASDPAAASGTSRRGFLFFYLLGT
jgi:hypothetical protein